MLRMSGTFVLTSFTIVAIFLIFLIKCVRCMELKIDIKFERRLASLSFATTIRNIDTLKPESRDNFGRRDRCWNIIWSRRVCEETWPRTTHGKDIPRTSLISVRSIPNILLVALSSIRSYEPRITTKKHCTEENERRRTTKDNKSCLSFEFSLPAIF